MSWYAEDEKTIKNMVEATKFDSQGNFRQIKLKDGDFVIISFLSKQPELGVLEHNVQKTVRTKDKTFQVWVKKTCADMENTGECEDCERERTTNGRAVRQQGLYFNVFTHRYYQRQEDGNLKDIFETLRKPETRIQALRLSNKGYTGLLEKLIGMEQIKTGSNVSTAPTKEDLDKHLWIYKRTGKTKDDTVYTFEKYTEDAGNGAFKHVVAAEIYSDEDKELIANHKIDFKEVLKPESIRRKEAAERQEEEQEAPQSNITKFPSLSKLPQ